MHQAQCFQHTGERSEAEGSRSFSLLVVLLHEPMPLKQQLGLSQKLFMSLLGLFLFFRHLELAGTTFSFLLVP